MKITLQSVMNASVAFLLVVGQALGRDPILVPLAEIKLSQYGQFSVQESIPYVEFGPQGDRVWVWLSNSTPPRKIPFGWLLVGTNGSLLASDRVVGVTQQFQGLEPVPEEIKWGSHFTNAIAFAVDKSGLHAASAYKEEREPPWRAKKRVVLTRIGGSDDVLWKRELEIIPDVTCLAFIESGGRKNLLVGLQGTEGLLLDVQTSQIVANFSYGPLSTDEDVIKRKKELGLSVLNPDDLKFWAYIVAVNEPSLMLAAGCFHDQRIRVVKLAEPFPALIELNTTKNPYRPRGGIWRVDKLCFAAKGRYLIAEYLFAGRGTKRVLRLTEIYETQGWKKVWETDDVSIQAVTLSPDGTKMAYLQKDVLKIVLFKPQK